MAECRHGNAQDSLRGWAHDPPPWLRVTPLSDNARPLPTGTSLDAGEDAALRLALQIQADLVLLDERRGRMIAAELGLAVTGTIGVLVEAGMRGIIDFEKELARLREQTNFRVDEPVMAVVDQLETQLTESNQKATHLLDAVVGELSS